MNILRSLACLLLAALPLVAAETKLTGRLLAAGEVRAEFRVLPDRRAAVTFLDASDKPAPRAARVVTVKVDGKDVPLEATSEGYLTKDPLPAKEPAPVVVQIRSAPDAKPTNFRLTLNTTTCGECQRPEYACTCAH